MQLTLRKLMHNIKALTEIGAEITSTHEFEEVIRASLHTMLGTLAIPRGAIAEMFLRPRQLKVIAAKGLTGALGEKIPIKRNEVEQFVNRARPQSISFDHNGWSDFAKRNREMLITFRVSLIVPMIACGELKGLVFLSEKFNGEDYTEEDLEIISTMAQHIGIALYNHRLLESYKKKAEENRRLYREMRQMYQDTVEAFGAAIDFKDGYTSGHTRRVALYAEAIAREMGVTAQELEYITVAGYLHDVGKIIVDRSIINKPGPLDDLEFEEMKQHVITGYEILSRIRHPWKEIAYMTRCHHERVDGSGYPDGLMGDDIPLGAKIISLVDSFDAMTTDRPYRDRLSLEQTLREIRRYADKQFDSRVVAAFCRVVLNEIEGRARQRVFLEEIETDFDHKLVISLLEDIVEELNENIVSDRELVTITESSAIAR